jgi:hypothetical protein
LAYKDEHIYIHPDVSRVRALHASVLDSFDLSDSILDLLTRMAENLCEANAAGDIRTLIEIRNYLRSGEYEEKEQVSIGLAQAREIMARQHGFDDWEEVKLGGRISLQPEFETAVDYLLTGNFIELKKMLDESPHLVIQRSSYYHKATLLHYVSSNGVEMRRQMVPKNLPEMISLLLNRGAQPDAMGYFYGRMMDVSSLLESGTHVRNAGIFEEVIRLLK